MPSNSKLLRVAVCAGLLLGTSSVFAEGGSVQTHHCKQADGTMDMKKTKKECKAAKGEWTKDAPATATSAAPVPVQPAPAPAPAPSK